MGRGIWQHHQIHGSSWGTSLSLTVEGSFHVLELDSQLKRLYTTDLKAVNHILVNYYDYPKPESAIYNIKRILGEGARFWLGYLMVTSFHFRRSSSGRRRYPQATGMVDAPKDFILFLDASIP